MARKTKYSLDSFREMVNSGRSKNEIMQELDIKNHPTFNNLMLKLMDTDKKYYQVKNARRAKSVKQTVAKIGKRNTLTLSSKNLDSSSFNAGDTFIVKFSKNKITLTLLDK